MILQNNFHFAKLKIYRFCEIERMKQGKLEEYFPYFVQIYTSCTKYKKYCARLDNMHKQAENRVND